MTCTTKTCAFGENRKQINNQNMDGPDPFMQNRNQINFDRMCQWDVVGMRWLIQFKTKESDDLGKLMFCAQKMRWQTVPISRQQFSHFSHSHLTTKHLITSHAALPNYRNNTAWASQRSARPTLYTWLTGKLKSINCTHDSDVHKYNFLVIDLGCVCARALFDTHHRCQMPDIYSHFIRSARTWSV